MNKDIFISYLINNIHGIKIRSNNSENVDNIVVTNIIGVLNNKDFQIEIVDSKYISVSLFAPETIFYNLVKCISLFLNQEPERYKVSNISFGIKHFNVKWNLK